MTPARIRHHPHHRIPRVTERADTTAVHPDPASEPPRHRAASRAYRDFVARSMPPRHRSRIGGAAARHESRRPLGRHHTPAVQAIPGPGLTTATPRSVHGPRIQTPPHRQRHEKEAKSPTRQQNLTARIAHETVSTHAP